MKRRILLAAMLAAGSGLLGALPGVWAGNAQIFIDNFSFSPALITVPAGTSVTWTNRDDIPHTVLGRDDPVALHSPPLDTDDSYSFTFAKPGTYRFFCSLHPQMQGTVVVQ